MKRFPFFFCFLLVLTACQGVSGPTSEFGTEGVTLDLVAPRDIFENTPSRFVVEVENAGTADVAGNGILVLTAPEAAFSSLADLRETLYLQGRSAGFPGEKTRVEFDLHANALPTGRESTSALVSATTCYEYASKASPSVCIEFPDDDAAPCSSGVVSTSGQGAPVSIRSVKTQLVPMIGSSRYQPLFTISLSNAGAGTVYEYQTVLNACSPSGRAVRDLVLLEAFFEHDGLPLVCGPKEESRTQVELKSGSAEVLCKLPAGIPRERGSHSAQILINAYYGYQESVSQSVRIDKVS